MRLLLSKQATYDMLFGICFQNSVLACVVQFMNYNLENVPKCVNMNENTSIISMNSHSSLSKCQKKSRINCAWIFLIIFVYYTFRVITMLSLVVVCGVDVMIKSLCVHTYSYSYIVLVLTNPCRSADKSVRARVDIWCRVALITFFL